MKIIDTHACRTGKVVKATKRKNYLVEWNNCDLQLIKSSDLRLINGNWELKKMRP
jgi:hypothetical protein